MTREPDDSQQRTTTTGNTPMTAPRPHRPSLHEITTAAHRAARRTALTLAQDLGATSTSRPLYYGSPVSRPDVEPIAGLRAARHVELASHQVAQEYIRAAREAGYTWQEIGRELEEELQAGNMTAHVNENIADTAYTYAVGPDPETARYYGQSFTWRCPSCTGIIRDHGLANGPADDEEGHAEQCARHAATIQAWNAEWDDLEADWEAGE